MKFAIFFSIIFALNVSATVFSQVVQLDRIAGIGGTVSVKELLREIENQTDYTFFYNDAFFDMNRSIALRQTEMDVNELLNTIFANTNLTFREHENNFVVITPKALAQSIVITGTITDKDGPLPGVTVTVKGTNIGITTNVDGQYQITAPNENAVLQFSFVGYNNVEMQIGAQREIDVELVESTQVLDELVVVGFGAQKKVNLTGSVAAVKVDETLAGRTLANVSVGLQGILPGLAVSQNSGMAGRNDVSLMIRGMGTINNAEPLIVVDGMPDVDINRIDMNDIESISVLKDAASSAVYGSRAANGVILITTRTGRGAEKTTVNLSGSIAWGVPTKAYKFMADYPRALTIHRNSDAAGYSESAQTFDKGTIDQWLALGMIDPVKYPNTDWWDIVLRTSKVQTYNLSATGSNDKSNFFASIGLMDENGLQINNDYTRYTARFNYDYKVKDNMNLGVRFSGNWTKYQYYRDDGFTSGVDENNNLWRAVAGITPYDPETGYFGGYMARNEGNQVYNPYVEMMNMSNNQNRQEIMPMMYFDWTFLKGLTAHVEYSINYYNQFRWRADIPAGKYNFQTERFLLDSWVLADAPVQNWTQTGYKTQSQGRLNYNATFASNHEVSVMTAYTEEYWYQRWQYGTRYNRFYPSMHELDAATPDARQNLNGRSESEGLRSVIGRINYTGFDRYLLEFSIRADASSKFLPGHQWGYFPSAAVGWRFTEEDFFKSFSPAWLTMGKVRVSYGSLGNNSAVERYEQKSTLASLQYVTGGIGGTGTLVEGYVNELMVNQDLSWESTAVMNLGLDVGFFNNRLTAELDYYDKLTTGMIQRSQLSEHLTGAYSPPRANIGSMRNRGVEANITWRERKGAFNYTININASYNRSVLEKWNDILDKGWIYLNMPYRFLYTYHDIGIVQTWQDIYDAPQQGNIAPGDIVRIDLNGDGRVDENDRVAYPDFQRNRPTANFGLNATASWKGIDAAVMFTGAAGRKDFWLTDYNSEPGRNTFASTWDHWYNPWSWDNRNGEWPRLNGVNSRQQTTFWLDDIAYLRLKNIQLGYSLPKEWLSVLKIENVRIYGTAENVMTITSFRGLDPERGGKGNSGGDPQNAYPLVKSFSVGINMRF